MQGCEISASDGGSGGVVTFLFTDIEGSTRLWEQAPGSMRVALGRHDEIVRSAISSFGGRVFSTMGDGVAAAFRDAAAALEAARRAQGALAEESWPADVGVIKVRMGLHTGAAEERDDDYFGPAVNRAARLMAIAHGGQVVCSAITAGLGGTSVPLIDLGDHRLRDLSRAERVWQLDLGGAPFAPLRSLDNLPGNLPVQLSEFIGRVDDVAAVAKALDAHRIVTLTGVGGVGKTRLALHVAAEQADSFRDGAWFCDLASVTSDDGVAVAVGDALGIDTAGAGTAANALVGRLRHHHSLLILDNCEHVLDAVATLVEQLARSCADVSILATSREGLAVEGEQILAVRSLRTPAAGEAPNEIVETAAARLFLARAQSVRSDLRLDQRSVEAIGEICRRLDGIPLALELAAARVQSLTPAEISERLDQRFRLLTRGGRSSLGRHHTLQATVDWSYELLEEVDRTALNWASTFAGGFTLTAAEHVVPRGEIEHHDVVDILDALVRRSMLVADEINGATRYRMLETIRQYGAERLEERGQVERARTAHLAWCLRFLIDCSTAIRGRDAAAWVVNLERELDNWRAAVSYAVESQDLDALAALFGTVPTTPLYGTRTGTAFAAAAAEALGAIGEPDHAAAAVLIALASYDRYVQAEYERGVELGLRSCELADRHAFPFPAFPRGFLVVSAFYGGMYDLALDAADEQLRIATQADDIYTVIEARGLRGLALVNLGRPDDALDAVAELPEIARNLESPLSLMHASLSAGLVRVLAGDIETGIPLLERSAELATVLENPFIATTALGFLATASSDIAASASRTRAALGLYRSLRYREIARTQFLATAAVLIRGGRHEAAAVLYGASGFTEPDETSLWEPTRRAAVAEMEHHLGASSFEHAVDHGRSLSVDEAIAMAIDNLNAIIEDAETTALDPT